MARLMLSAIHRLMLVFALAASFAASGSVPVLAGGLSPQPQDVRFVVETADGRTRFRIGETIPLNLSFTSSAAKKYQINLAAYDRSGRMHYETFAVEPDEGWSDPLRAYFVGGAHMMGGFTNFRFLSPRPTVISVDLNEWVRFDCPGDYVLRVVSRRVGELAGSKPYSESATELTSDELRLTILPASAAWQRATLKSAIAALDKSLSGGGTTASAPHDAEVVAAMRTLRFLGTAEAVGEMARRMRGENHGADFEGMFGLVSSPHRDVALREMRRLMNDPDHPVSSGFVYTLTLLRRDGDLTIETRAAEDAKNREAVRGELLEAVSRKRGRALALTLNTVLEVGNGDCSAS